MPFRLKQMTLLVLAAMIFAPFALAEGIKVDCDFPGNATIVQRMSLDAESCPQFRCEVFVPEKAGPTIKAYLFLKNKDGEWFQCERTEPLFPGRRTKLMFDLSPSSAQVRPIGNFRRWDATAAAEIEFIGLRFISDEEFKGQLTVENFRIQAAPKPPEKLAILDFRTSDREVAQYDLLEMSFNVNRIFENPFDPDVVSIDCEITDPEGKKLIVPAFFYQPFLRVDADLEVSVAEKADVKTWRLLEDFMPAGASCWKIRFAPMMPGKYKYVIRITDSDNKETLATEPREFCCAESKLPGYIRPAADRTMFEFSNGALFYPIGHNIHSSNDVSERNCKTLGIKPPNDRGTEAYADIFRKMAKAGENSCEIWMASWSLDFEWTDRWKNYHGLGRYNMPHAFKLDRIIELARQNGIYINLVLENHGKASSFVDAEWQDNPYNAANDGFANNTREFFTSPECRAQYKKKLRYLIARWGYATNIMGFSLWSELDLTGERHEDFADKNFTDAKLDWHKDITKYTKDLDLGRHMLTTHYSGDFRKIQRELIMLPNIDYVTVDAYRDKDAISLLLDLGEKAILPANKPFLITEYGGSPFGTSLSRLEADLHTGLWSGYMMNYAGAPMLWWYVYIDQHNKYTHYKAFSKFTAGEDRRNKNFTSGYPELKGDPNLAGYMLKSKESAYLWIFDKRSAADMPKAPFEHAEGTAVILKHCAAGDYTIEVWNTYTGIIVSTAVKTAHDDKLEFSLPAFRNDVAVKVKRK